MSGEFASLYRELTNLTPSTRASDTDFKKQRINVLQRLGMVGEDKHSIKMNGNLGKKARQRTNAGHQAALHAGEYKMCIS